MSCSHWFCYYCCCCCCRCCSAKQSSKKVVVVAQVEPSEDQRAGVAATSHHSHSVSPSARIKQHQQQQQSNSKPNPRQKETGKEHHKLAAHSSGPHSSAATAPAPAPSLPLERLPRSVSTPIRKYKSHKPKKGSKSLKPVLTSASNATATCAATTTTSPSTTAVAAAARIPSVVHSVSSSPIAITSGALLNSGSRTDSPTVEPLLSSSSSSSPPSKSGSKGTEAKTEFSQMESPPDWPPTELPPVQVGNVTAWSTDFDVLLADPLGVRAFEDFLSREFSVENLSFFLACRRLYGQSGSTLSASIEHIYRTYLSTEATEPVNVDSSAIKQIEAALAGEHRNHTLFAPAEKQIYNLMKFDCYPRFLRSHIYTECFSAEQSGRPLPYEEHRKGYKKSAAAADHSMTTTTTTVEHSASADHSPGQSSEEQAGKGASGKSKRRSFLPWARIKSSLVNAKAASLSSMPANKESTGGNTPSSSSSSAAAAFRRPMAVRKFASSITYKLRSRSLDEHIHANASGRPSASPNSSTEKGPAGLAGHSSSVEQAGSRGEGGQEESLDLDSAAPVFSPSPDDCGEGGGASRVASLSSCSTSAEGSPVGTAPPHPSLLRVTFPDGSTTVVACSKSAESLGDLVQRLLLKRGFDWLKDFDVYRTAVESPPLNLTALVSSIGCSEVRIHARNLSAKSKPRLNAFSLLHPTAHSSGSASLDHSPTGAKPQRVQRSLEEGPVTNPSAPMRRFNSVNIDAAVPGGSASTSGLAKPNYTQTGKASPPNIQPQTIPRPKASHLRDLQNHRHFKSQSEGPEVSPKASSKPSEMTLAQCERHSSSTAVSQTPDSPKPSLRRFTSDPPLPELSQTSSASSKKGHPHPNAPSTVSPKSLPSLFHVHLDHAHHHHHHHPHHPIIYHTQFQHQEHSHVHLIPQRRSSGNSATSSTGAATSAAAPLTGKMAKNSSLS